GAKRPGDLVGVITVVDKLASMCMQGYANFGKNEDKQVAIVEHVLLALKKVK
ncbi:pantoate--beta-alanine ligase, partial [Staphylococcus aureus]